MLVVVDVVVFVFAGVVVVAVSVITTNTNIVRKLALIEPDLENRISHEHLHYVQGSNAWLRYLL